MEEIEAIRLWCTEHVPATWFESSPDIVADRDEVLVIGRLGDGWDSQEPVEERVKLFRDQTREERARLGREGQELFQRKVSWAVELNGTRHLFTRVSVPVMTRLCMEERAVLDTLVDSGVARTRSHALAWCVRLVAQHEGDWLDELKQALVEVERARAHGPADAS